MKKFSFLAVLAGAALLSVACPKEPTDALNAAKAALDAAKTAGAADYAPTALAAADTAAAALEAAIKAQGEKFALTRSYTKAAELAVAAKAAADQAAAQAVTGKEQMKAEATALIADVEKHDIPPSAQLILLGGPAMLIGLGGGAASSMSSGTIAEDLYFASVQRGNPEMQRRAQEVIDRCWAMGADNPIISIHDVGAGGISNALPELVNDSGRGARFELRAVPNDDPGMSPMQIWSNESQERYVLAVAADRIEQFQQLCEREPCRFEVVGEATEEQQLIVGDAHFENLPVDMPMSLLLGKPPKMLRDVHQSTSAPR